MKSTKRNARTASKPVPVPKPAARGLWVYLLACFLTFSVALQFYKPCLSGPFLFDDDYLPFNTPNFTPDIRAWVMGVRPLLMFTYWVNYKFSGLATSPYHFLNVLFHTASAILAYFFIRKILEYAGLAREKLLLFAAFGGGIFLLHPVQTESVAYVASRSESLSGMFLLAAMVAYIYRRSPVISWGRAIVALLLSLAALATKEHTLILPVLLLVTDYYWNPGFSWQGARRNWRFYVPMAVGGLGGAVFVWRILKGAASAGFSLKEFTWYQYFFTECRAFFVYLRLFLFPVGQTVDYDFPVSRTILDHGAVFALAGILLLLGAAWYYRRRYPLASYGLVIFLILMAPTSSFVPIKDPIAEHRLYLAILGLLFIVMEVLRRVSVPQKTLAIAFGAIVLLAGILTYERNQVWSDPIALWQDTVEKSPRLYRPHFQLAYAYFSDRQCGKAVSQYETAAKLRPPTHDLLVDWALAYDCENRLDEALDKLQQASRLEGNAHVYTQIAMIYAKQSKWQAALDALKTAESLDAGYAMTYVYRGDVMVRTGETSAAIMEYRHALTLEPQNQVASEHLVAAERLLARPR